MDMNMFQTGNWLNAAALGPTPRPFVIQSVTPQEVDEGKPPKPVVMFMGESRGLPLNKTNMGFLITAFGSESDAWIGRTIELFTTPVNFQGQIVSGVRMRLPAAVAQPAVQPVQPAQVAPQPAQLAPQPAQVAPPPMPAQPVVDVNADIPRSVEAGLDYRV